MQLGYNEVLMRIRWLDVHSDVVYFAKSYANAFRARN